MNKLTNALTALLLAGTATNATANETEHPVRLMLLTSLIDQSPNRADLIEAGAGPRGQGLTAMVFDRSVSRYQRARAAAMLGYWPESQQDLQKIIESKELDPEIRVQAIGALAFALKAGAWPLLKPLLDAPRPELVNATARALLRLNDPRVQAELSSRIGRFSRGTQSAIRRRLREVRASTPTRR